MLPRNRLSGGTLLAWRRRQPLTITVNRRQWKTWSRKTEPQKNRIKMSFLWWYPSGLAPPAAFVRRWEETVRGPRQMLLFHSTVFLHVQQGSPSHAFVLQVQRKILAELGLKTAFDLSKSAGTGIWKGGWGGWRGALHVDSPSELFELYHQQRGTFLLQYRLEIQLCILGTG